jgi:hypothetical protein
MRKVTVKFEAEVTVEVDEGVVMQDVMENLTVCLEDNPASLVQIANIVDFSIGDFEVTDSR